MVDILVLTEGQQRLFVLKRLANTSCSLVDAHKCNNKFLPKRSCYDCTNISLIISSGGSYCVQLVP